MGLFAKLKQSVTPAVTRLKSNGAIHVVIGSFLTKFVTFFGSIFFVRLLSKSDYGILSYYENLASYFTLFAGLGLAVGLQRYMVIAKDDADKKSCYERALKRGSAWNILFVAVFITFCLIYPHPESFRGYKGLGIQLTLCIPFYFCMEASLSALRAKFDNKSYAVLALLTAAIMIIFRIIGAALLGLPGTTWARLIAEVACAVICVLFVFRKHFSGVRSGELTKPFCREMDVFSFQIMLTNGLWAIFMLNDQFLLGQLLGNEAVLADYKIAYVIPANLSILTSAIGIFIAPYFTKHENEKDGAWVKRNYYLVLKTTVAIMGVFVLICFIFAKPLIVLLYGEDYASAVPIMRILLLASFCNNGVRATIANILSSIGVQKLNLIVAAGGMLLQVTLDLILIPRYGGIGVAYTSLIVYAMMSIVLGFLFNKKVLHRKDLQG